MADNPNKLVPPSKKTVKFLFDGLVLFFPQIIYEESGKNYPTVDYWVGTGYRRAEFTQLLFNITGKGDLGEAADQVKKWKLAWDQGETPSATIPEKLDNMLSDLAESPTKTKLSAYDQQRIAKEALHLSQVHVEESLPSAPPPTTGISSQAPVEISGPLSVFAGKILTIPFRAAVYISGPAVYSKDPGLATARFLLTHDISLPTKAQGLGISPAQLKNLARLIKIEQEAHPSAYKWISIIYSGQKARLPQSQILALLEPSKDGSIAVLPGKSFLGNFFGRIGQQLFGRVASETLKAIGKKTATTAIQTAATAVGVGAGGLPFLVGQMVLGKIKNLLSSLKAKRGKEAILALLFGSMLVGGLAIGGLPGAILTAGAVIPGVGYLSTKAGGLGTMGKNISSYSQAFLTGITDVFTPAIAAPAIIALFAVPFSIAVVLFIVNSGAYIVPPQTSLVPGLIESPYIDIRKTASPSGPFQNGDLPLVIEYTVEIVAKKGSLTNIEFKDSCEVIKEGSPPNCPPVTIPKAPQIISPVEPYSFSYSVTYDAKYTDSFIINTLTITADAPEQAGAQAATSASIKIGTPPEDCPYGWPGFGTMNQGAYSTSTHRNAEAIDIGMIVGNTITARHSGIVRSFGNVGPYGKHVEIVSTCNGKEFFSRYAHLSVVSVQTGQKVKMGQAVGLSGDTGNSSGPHLHYEFRDSSGPKKYPDDPPYMMRPYVLKDLPRACVGRTVCQTLIP
jgi:hypothetical protein